MNPIVIVILLIVAFFLVRGFMSYRADEARKAKIMSYAPQWGIEACKLVYNRKVTLNMTQDMVLLSWGKPTSIDQRQTTEKSHRERWVYGVKGKANYVHFTNGVVSKTASS